MHCSRDVRSGGLLPRHGRCGLHCGSCGEGRVDETPSACRRQTIESLVIAFGETPADCVAQISGNRPCEKGYRTFKPLVHPLPREFDDGDAAGRLERFFLPEPALR